MEYFTFGAEQEDVGTRIDVFLADAMENLSRSGVQKLIEEGHITLNGGRTKANYKLRERDIIDVEVPEVKEVEILPEDIPLDILYEDADVIVVNKPQGMVVHPAPGHTSGTLVNALMFHCGNELSGINGEKRPGIVHRIDKDTSGLLVVAKTDAAHQALTEQMSVHSIHRVYHAVVYGNLKEDTGFVEAPIGRDPKDRKKMAVTQQNSKYAYTGWQVLERFGNFTYIACKLKTGRTHQIRVHMASIGHPLAGDAVYGPKNCIRSLNGQCLHAKELGFVHPATGEWMQFDSSLPDWFQDYLSRLRKESRHGAFE